MTADGVQITALNDATIITVIEHTQPLQQPLRPLQVLQRYKIVTQRPYRGRFFAVLYSLLSQNVCLTVVL